MQNHKFPAKLHKKFKTNSNNHPKNSYKQKYNHATTSQYQKIVIAWTKSPNSFKGNVPLIWKTITQRPEQNQNHHQWKKWTAEEHGNNNNHDRMTGIRTRMDDRNTRIDRRRTSGWEEDEEQTMLHEMWEANALYGRLTLGFYNNRIKGIFDFSSSVLVAPSNTPSPNVLNSIKRFVWHFNKTCTQYVWVSMA